MSSDPTKAFIVSHTHWDREWYEPYHHFRLGLVKVVRQVLDVLEQEEGFEHFLLDGQTIILEDYLEIHPEDKERIVRQVQRSALAIGPWYVLADGFLVSGEATVRNLNLGHKVGSAFGPVQKIGYLPDSFGHIAQMPQILRQAGIDSFVYTRGNGDEIEKSGWEYDWVAPDGSEVLAINQCGGYCNAAGLGLQELWHAHTNRVVDAELAVGQVRELFAKMAPLSKCDIRLLNNGCDHFGPQKGFTRIIESLRQAFPQTEFLHASLGAYIEAVRSAGFVKSRHTGELLHGKMHPILTGVWSARIYLKQQNHRGQVLLSDYVEPLCAYSHFLLAQPYPQGAIDYAWKLLLKNHPHDSICGCSTDDVHRDMEQRFAGVFQAAEKLLRDQLVHWTPTFGRKPEDDANTALCVFNPLPEERTEIVERLVVLQAGIDPDRLRLFDGSGREIPFSILEKKFVERFWGIDYRTELFCAKQRACFETYLKHFGQRILGEANQEAPRDCFLTVQFLVDDLPPLGHTHYYLRCAEDSGDAPRNPDSVTTTADSIENEYYKVRLHPNGTLDVFDKATGTEYLGLNRLEDTEDIGDEYDYSPAEDSQTITSEDCSGQLQILEQSGLSGRIEAAYTLRLPESIEPSRRRRSKESVECKATTRVCLRRGSRAIEIEQTLDNRAKDHRLRAEFPTPIETETIISDGHFYINHRPIRQPEGTDWVQPPSGTYPQQDFSILQDGAHGIAVLNKGLPEIAATRNRAGHAKLSLTLLRAVGWLSRDDFPTRRRSNAGPTIHTPDAQCLGVHRFEYALVPFGGDHIAADIKGLSQRYKTPLLVIQGVEDQHVEGGAGLLGKATRSTSISAVKKHEERDTLVVRLYNLTANPVDEKLIFGMGIVAAWRTNLLEERTAELVVGADSQVPIRLKPHEIVTVELEPGA